MVIAVEMSVLVNTVFKHRLNERDESHDQSEGSDREVLTAQSVGVSHGTDQSVPQQGSLGTTEPRTCT